MSPSGSHHSPGRSAPIFHRMFAVARDALGPQGWWPAKTPFEVCVGAILTQNTAWTNVERAIANLKDEDCLSAAAIHRMPTARLARLIRPAGYFNVKARRLKSFVSYLLRELGGDITRIREIPLEDARRALLAVNGVGPETADSMLLYAAGIPSFVCDAYTRRILHRHGLCAQDAEYHVMQDLLHQSFPDRDVQTFNEFHALIVAIGKDYCRPTNPRCEACPFRVLLTPAQRRRISSRSPETRAKIPGPRARSTTPRQRNSRTGLPRSRPGRVKTAPR